MKLIHSFSASKTPYLSSLFGPTVAYLSRFSGLSNIAWSNNLIPRTFICWRGRGVKKEEEEEKVRVEKEEKWQQRRRKSNPRGIPEGLEYQKCLRIWKMRCWGFPKKWAGQLGCSGPRTGFVRDLDGRGQQGRPQLWWDQAWGVQGKNLKVGFFFTTSKTLYLCDC